MTLIGVGVKKFILRKLAENSSRQDALQAVFLDRVDIFYHRILGRFCRKRVFQHPHANALIELQFGATECIGNVCRHLFSERITWDCLRRLSSQLASAQAKHEQKERDHSQEIQGCFSVEIDRLPGAAAGESCDHAEER